MRGYILIVLMMICQPIGCWKLSPLTKEVVKLLVEDADEQRIASGDVYLSAWTDSSHYYLNAQLIRDNSKVSPSKGRPHVKYLTSQGNPFFKANRCSPAPNQDDLKHVQICLNKDKSFCPMFSYYTSPTEDISQIIKIIERHKIKSKVSKADLNYIYPAYFVESPPEFKLGRDSLQAIIQKNLGSVAKFHRKVVINLIIDQRGYAEIDGIEVGSGDIDVDRKALSIAEMIAKNEFIPAKHRGFEVRSYYSLVIKL